MATAGCFAAPLTDESDCTREAREGPFFSPSWTSQLLLVRRTGQGGIDWSWSGKEARLAKRTRENAKM